MADPVKSPNRLKPFQRINNDEAIVKAAPDGLGVPCGCHTPAEFGDLEEKFKEFLDKELPVPLFDILKKVKAVLDTAANIARAAAVALLFGFGPAVVAVIAAVIAFINKVVSVIDTIVNGFFVRIGRRLALRAIRVCPQWVPVLRGASNKNITADQIIEVEGTVTRSYGDPIEPPFFQWHRWLNWSVQIQLEDKYNKALSPASNPPNTQGAQRGERPIAKPNSFEIQWDTGAMMEVQDKFESGFTETEMPDIDGPMTTGEWIWPTAGMFVWASGRWVYDCSRTTDDANPKMCAMMNPPRAIATATWEAVQFPENDPNDQKPSKVPAIRFLFFACKRGGYMDYDTLADKDYEFILDLPPLESKTHPFPVQITPDNPHNVIVVRPRLLKSLVSLPLRGVQAKLLKPIVKIIPQADPSAPPKQVKVIIPKAQLDGATAAGMILSLGWFDPNLERAATVKKCSVSIAGLEGRFTVRDNPLKQIRDMFQKELDDLKKEINDQVAKIEILPGVTLDNFKIPNPFSPGDTIDLAAPLKAIINKLINTVFDELLDLLIGAVGPEVETEEWLFRVGINGRWHTRFFPKMDKGAFALANPILVDLFLGPDDFLFFSTGGVEFNPVGDMMRAARSKRLIKKTNDQPFTWDEIVNATGDERTQLVFKYTLEVLAGNSASKNPALGLENTILGILDPDFTKPGEIPETANPFAMKFAQPETAQFRRLARFARATVEQSILLEDPSKDDYQISALVQITNQR